MKALNYEVGEWWGFIVDGVCRRVRFWSEVSVEMIGPQPRQEDFDDAWHYEEYEIKPIKITWE
jgi:hypothetical protein